VYDVGNAFNFQGARTVRKLLPEAVHIFLVAESEAELVERLVSRKTEPLVIPTSSTWEIWESPSVGRLDRRM